MGAGASLTPPNENKKHHFQLQYNSNNLNNSNNSNSNSNNNKQYQFNDGLSVSYRKLQKQGLNDQEIYRHLRESYGSLRLNKKLTINDGTIRGLAIQNLSHTLETHRISLSNNNNNNNNNFNNVNNKFEYKGTNMSTISSIGQSPSSSSSSNNNNTNANNNNTSISTSSIQTKDDDKNETNSITSNSTTPTNANTSTTAVAVAAAKPVARKKPKLNIVVQDEESNDVKSESNVIIQKQQTSAMKTPREYARMSPSGGALYIGDFAINEKGITSFNPLSDHHHSFLTAGISDFVMIGKLGRGASGSVVEAIHIPTLTIVALKLLPIRDSEDLHHISSELAVLYQNLAELSLLTELHDTDENSKEVDEEYEQNDQNNDVNRDNILLNGRKETTLPTVKSSCPQLLGMYDAFLDPVSGVVNLIVEYMDGGSLQDVVDGGGCIDEEVLADIAYQVLIGLDFLHSNGHMHRDIKPGNILLSCDGSVKVADFGISKAMDPNGIPQPNSFVGTLCYMAPERISNDRYGLPGDIWSFGLTLLAVAQGRFPLFLNETEPLGYWDLYKLICEEEPPIPGGKFSNELNLLVSSCLQKDPAMRPTAAMLMQHPFFLKHADVILRSSAMTHSRTTTRASNGCGITPTNRQSIPDESILNILSCDEDGSDSKNNDVISAQLDDQGFNSQSALSRLTEKRLSRAGSKLTQTSPSIKNPISINHNGSNNDSNNNLVTTPTQTTDKNDSILLNEEDEMITAIRLEHLERIVEKVESRYNQYVLMRKRDKEKLKQQQQQQNSNNNNSGYVQQHSSFRSMMSSRSFFKSSKDPLTPIPNITSITGKLKWEHFSSQLHLPVEIVTATAGNIISPKFFAR